MVDEFGNDLMPATLTEAAISEVYIERQKSPYPAKCIDSWDSTNYTSYVKDNRSYSLQSCQRVCSHSSILETCECFHPMFVDDAYGAHACNLTSESDELACVEDVMYQLDNSIRNCTCGPTCIEQDYDVFISQSFWPAKQYRVSSVH